MACCGGKRGAAAIPAAPRVQETRSAINAPMPANTDGLVLVRYVGGSVGSQTFKAPSGMMYRFGLADPLKKVIGADADWFAQMPTFQVVPA